MRFTHKKSLLALSIAVLSAFTPTLVGAASVQSITLSPSATDLTIVAGTPATRNLTLVDDGDTDYPVKLYVEPYHVTDSNYDPVFTRLPGTTDPSSWVTLSQKQLDLKSHQTSVVPYTINAPAGTAPGGYYAVIFAQTATTSDSGGVSAQNRVGNILYITVDGESKTSGKLETASLPPFIFSGNVPLSVNITNTGGVHFQSQTHMTVSSILGNNVYTSDTTHYILPQTTRLVTSNWSPNAPIGIYKVTRSSTIAGNEEQLPDATIVVARPSFLPLLLFILLTIGGIVIIVKNHRKNKRAAKNGSRKKTEKE